MSMPPPLPPPVPPRMPDYRAQGASGPRAGQRPPKKNNGCLIALAIVAGLSVPLIGILAAIALPAYQDYTFRVRVMQGVIAVKTRVDPVFAQSSNGSCPGNGQPGIPGEREFGIKDVERVQVGSFGDGSGCGYAVTFGGTGNARLDGKTVWMKQSASGWHCESDFDKKTWLPAFCRQP